MLRDERRGRRCGGGREATCRRRELRLVQVGQRLDALQVSRQLHKVLQLVRLRIVIVKSRSQNENLMFSRKK